MTDERDADPSSQQPLNIAARALKKKRKMIGQGVNGRKKKDRATQQSTRDILVHVFYVSPVRSVHSTHKIERAVDSSGKTSSPRLLRKDGWRPPTQRLKIQTTPDSSRESYSFFLNKKGRLSEKKKIWGYVEKRKEHLCGDRGVFFGGYHPSGDWRNLFFFCLSDVEMETDWLHLLWFLYSGTSF
jgi:hypothetical protein